MRAIHHRGVQRGLLIELCFPLLLRVLTDHCQVEKAHPDILTLMLQIFDEGRLTDEARLGECPSDNGAR